MGGPERPRPRPVARVKIVLRRLRGRGPKGGGAPVSFGRWTFDIAHRRLQGSGDEVALFPSVTGGLGLICR